MYAEAPEGNRLHSILFSSAENGTDPDSSGCGMTQIILAVCPGLELPRIADVATSEEQENLVEQNSERSPIRS